MPSGRSQNIKRNHHEAEGAGSGRRRAHRRDCPSVKGQYRGPSQALEDLVWQGAVSPYRPVPCDSGDRLPPPGKGFRRSQAVDPTPALSGRRRDRGRELEEEPVGSKGGTGNNSGPRMAREHAPGHGAERRSVLQGQALPFTLRDRARNHRQSLVRTAILRATIACDGEQPWNALNHQFDAARSTPANLPKKDWSRTSTRCTRSARLAKRSSKARPVQDGAW